MYLTELTTKKCKTEKNYKVKTDMLRSNCKSLMNHVVSPGEEKERPQWEGFAGKEGFCRLQSCLHLALQRDNHTMQLSTALF